MFLENELLFVQGRVNEDYKPDTRSKIKKLMASYVAILGKILARNDELVILADETRDPSKLLAEFAWWKSVTKVND